MAISVEFRRNAAKFYLPAHRSLAWAGMRGREGELVLTTRQRRDRRTAGHAQPRLTQRDRAVASSEACPEKAVIAPRSCRWCCNVTAWHQCRISGLCSHPRSTVMHTPSALYPVLLARVLSEDAAAELELSCDPSTTQLKAAEIEYLDR